MARAVPVVAKTDTNINPSKNDLKFIDIFYWYLFILRFYIVLCQNWHTCKILYIVYDKSIINNTAGLQQNLATRERKTNRCFLMNFYKNSKIIL